MRFRSLSLSLVVGALLAAPSSLWAQATYFTGPFGPNGTWDVYEYLGSAVTGNFATALEAATFPSPPQFGPTVTGSLASIHSGAEHLMVWHAGGYTAGGNDMWIGLTDLPAYGGGESGTPVDAARLKGFTGPGGTPGPGWVWTDGTPYDYMAWGGGEPNNAGSGEGAAHIRSDGLWNDNNENTFIVKFVTKYPTHLATAPAGATNFNDLFGPVTTVLPKVDNQWTIREAYLGATGTVDNLSQSIGLNKNPGAATVKTYNAPVLNILDTGGGGRFAGDSQLQVVKDGVVPAGTEVNQIAILAQAKIVIPAGQGGDYTFGVNSDDGFRMTIAGHPFTSVDNGFEVQGAAVYAVGRGVADTFAHVNLAPGEYDLQVESWEGTGGAAWEVFAAPGNKTTFDPTVFRLVGYKGTNQPLTVGGVAMVNGWHVESSPPGGTALNTVPDAQAEIAAGGLTVLDNVATVNYADPESGGTNRIAGRVAFPSDVVGADDNDWALHATGTLRIPTAGTYTFGFASDDGAQLTIAGANFTAVSAPGGGVIGTVNTPNDSLIANFNTGDSFSLAEGVFAAGDYAVDFISWERGGGAFMEVYGMKGGLGSAALIFALGDTSTTTYLDSDGIHIAPFSGGGPAKGDMNGDGSVNNLDIAPFSLALTNPAQFATDFPNVPILTGDINNNGSFNNLDISPFAALLVGGPAAVPEPSTFVLAGLGLVALVGVARRRAKA